MKKNILSMACVLLITGAFAQTRIVKANPLGALLGLASLSYEDASQERFMSYQLNLNYGQLSAPGGKYTGIGGGLDMKSYAFSRKKDSPKGLYVSLGIIFSRVTLKIDGEETQRNTIGSGKLVGGYQLIFNNGFSLDLFGGMMYHFNGSFEVNRVTHDKFNGWMPTAGLAFGYAFGEYD